MESSRVPASHLVRIEDLDPDAIAVIRRLAEADHEAYLVGGCVRDVLVGRRPKDFDVATSATPRQVRRLFRDSRVIGRRFLLAHVSFGPKIIEVSTFRQSPEETEDSEDHLIRRDNIFGTAVEDALRRDFTMNALFYDPQSEAIVDHVGGLPDIEARIIRTIGVASVRIQEDPVRIIRAARLGAQIDFTLDEDLREAMETYSSHIEKSAPPRVQEEIFRILESGVAEKALRVLVEVGCFGHIYPTLADMGVESSEAPPEDGIPEDRLVDWDEEEGEVTEEPQPEPESELDFSRLLGALDEVVKEKGRPPRSVLLAILILKGIRSRPDQHDLFRSVWEYLTPFRTNNRISRKDAEQCAQILAFQKKIFGRPSSRKGKRRPEHLLQIRTFPLALALADVETRATGQDREVIQRWEDRMREEGMDPLSIYQTGPVFAAGRRRRRSGPRKSDPRKDRRGRGRGRGERGEGRKPRRQEAPPSKKPPAKREERPRMDKPSRPPPADAPKPDASAPFMKVRRPEKKDEEKPAGKAKRARGWERTLKRNEKPKRRRAARKRV